MNCFFQAIFWCSFSTGLERERERGREREGERGWHFCVRFLRSGTSGERELEMRREAWAGFRPTNQPGGLRISIIVATTSI